MEHIEIGELLDFGAELADLSGEIIAKYYRNLPSLETKPDQSPVTIADKEVEDALIVKIKEAYPQFGIIGEETGSHNNDSAYQWVIDPIDGTTAFAAGRPSFGTLIALVHGNVPIFGIINQPILKERWVGIPDEMTMLNDRAATVSGCTRLSEAIVCTTAPEYFTTPQLKAFVSIANQSRYPLYGGDCYNYGLLASGHVDAVIEAGLKPHDFCALAAVVSGAGGVITDWHGNRLTTYSDGTVIAAASDQLHQTLLSIVQPGQNVA